VDATAERSGSIVYPVASVPPNAPAVLLVGQDEQVRELFEGLLTLRGHAVRSASSLDAAVELCRTEDVGAVLVEAVDADSPWADLPAVLARALGANAPPVVVVTGSWALDQTSDPDASQPGVTTFAVTHRVDALLDLVARHCRRPATPR
jgi:DNA-binding NtrC family response regulator